MKYTTEGRLHSSAPALHLGYRTCTGRYLTYLAYLTHVPYLHDVLQKDLTEFTSTLVYPTLLESSPQYTRYPRAPVTYLASHASLHVLTTKIKGKVKIKIKIEIEIEIEIQLKLEIPGGEE